MSELTNRRCRLGVNLGQGGQPRDLCPMCGEPSNCHRGDCRLAPGNRPVPRMFLEQQLITVGGVTHDCGAMTSFHAMCGQSHCIVCGCPR